MNEREILQRVTEEKVIAIVRGVSRETMLPVLQAMLDGGLSCAEITFDHSCPEGGDNTLESIYQMRSRFGNSLALGAGTVLTVKEVELAAQAGADYIISPNMDVHVIRETKRLHKVSIPGAFTASEVVAAYAAGADVVKLFPAAVMGSTYIKALRDPLAHIPMSAVGGITPENAAEFLAAGCCCVGVGGSLVNAKLANEKNFFKIAENARKFVAALR